MFSIFSMDIFAETKMPCQFTSFTYYSRVMVAAFAPLVDDLLGAPGVTLTFVPADIERAPATPGPHRTLHWAAPTRRARAGELYFNILRLLLNVAATSAGPLRLDVFGVRADFAFR